MQTTASQQEPETDLIIISDSPSPNAGGVYRIGPDYYWAPDNKAEDWRPLTLQEALTATAEIYERSNESTSGDIPGLLREAAQHIKGGAR